MQKLKLFALSPEILCDRCNTRTTESYMSICPKCFQVPPESVRQSEHKFGSADHNICGICGTPSRQAHLKQVCPGCFSKHPDSTHGGFGRSETAIYSYCDRCGSLQLMERAEKGGGITYYKTGYRYPLSEPFVCPRETGFSMADIQSQCAHDWLKVQALPPETGEPLEHNATQLFVTDEQVEALKEAIRCGSSTFWCWKCGVVNHLRQGNERLLPEIGLGP